MSFVSDAKAANPRFGNDSDDALNTISAADSVSGYTLETGGR